jgi:hypothetical protein
MTAAIKDLRVDKTPDSRDFQAVLPDLAAARAALTARPELAVFAVARAEAALATAWPALPASLYLDFAQTGTRSTFETAVFRRRELLRDLTYGEIVEGQGRFSAAIADAAWSITEEATWCWPAHLFLQKAGYGLPDIDEPVVDLGTGVTAGLLAMVHRLMAQPLDAVSPMIRKRIERTVRQRLLDPCRDRDDFWWMGLSLHPLFHVIRLNNWNSWIGSNWLLAHLVFETEPSAFAHGVDRIIATLDRLLATYGEDGGCPEGPAYWRVATAGLLQCLELLRPILDPERLRSDLRLRNFGRFVAETHIAGDYYVNFADGAPQARQPAGLVRRWADLVDDTDLRAEADRLASRQGLLEQKLTEAAFDELIGTVHQSVFDTLSSLSVLPKLTAPQVEVVRAPTLYLPSLEMAIVRDQQADDQGWFLAAKAGHNGDSHNHNDVGSFLLYRDGKPLIVDAGVGTYTAQTFSDRRYEIWTMRSHYHNVPLVNGCEQSAGAAFGATDVAFVSDIDGATLSMNIAGAYPSAAGLRGLKRKVQAVRGGDITVEDALSASSPIPFELHLLSAADAAEIAPGEIALVPRELAPGRPSGAGRLSYPPQMEAIIEIVPMEDPALSRHWGTHLTLLRFRHPQPVAEFTSTIVFSEENQP